MKKFFFGTILFLMASVSFAQVQNPVHWEFTAKKISSTEYEIHLKATIDNNWHTYSQSTPDGGPVPTKIEFTNNPLLTLIGKVKEVGKMETHHDESFGVDVKQFSKSVDFVQVVKVKSNIKSTISGSVEFMVCNDHECLPPTTKQFSISLK